MFACPFTFARLRRAALRIHIDWADRFAPSPDDWPDSLCRRIRGRGGGVTLSGAPKRQAGVDGAVLHHPRSLNWNDRRTIQPVSVKRANNGFDVCPMKIHARHSSETGHSDLAVGVLINSRPVALSKATQMRFHISLGRGRLDVFVQSTKHEARCNKSVNRNAGTRRISN